MCNTIPSFDLTDYATWRRTICVEFPTQFVDKPEKPHEKMADRGLKRKWQIEV